LPTESVSRDGVWDGIYLVVRSAALEPRAGTPRRARLRWLRSPKAGDGNDLNDVRFRVPAQPVDATQALNLSAGVSNLRHTFSGAMGSK